MEVLAHLRRMTDEAVSLDHLEHRQRRRACKRVSTEGRSVVAGLKNVGLRRCQAGSDWNPTPQALGQRHDVRCDAVMLMCEPAAGPAEPCLDLIQDEQ